ncbi:MAG: class I mannose-6-phosphate isomerase, partial [Limisphaerales bacterium]
ELGGEPKTEMWFIAQAAPGAELFVGLKRGVTRAEFETKIKNGTVADCFHRIKVKSGDAIFLPSGRVHAIGAGLIIFEIQQNSDTTYRVFDWNRLDTKGKSRELHIEQSLSSIDFNDFEPMVFSAQPFRRDGLTTRPLARDPLFSVDVCETSSNLELPSGVLQIIGVVEGNLAAEYRENKIALAAGNFCLVPAHLENVRLHINSPVSFLQIRAS